MATGYVAAIMDATGCDETTARMVEDIMREVVFHSTLDWQTREVFDEGARMAYLVLKATESAGDA